MIDAFRTIANTPPASWTSDLFDAKGTIPYGAFGEKNSAQANSEMEMSAGQASVIVRKSDEQRNIDNTKALRGVAEFHDPLIDPCLGGMNE
eukprot:11928281-Karenia_brevis.AAC.1